MTIKEYINLSKIDKSKTTINDDDTFIDMTTDINQANEHLLTYFKKIKEEGISQLMELMSKLESSYEESFNRNKDMLTFIQILIDNYDGSIEMKKNILNNDIKIYQCKYTDNFDEVIRYYNKYNII